MKLRYDQPNRPRAFKVPGGKFGAWFVAGLGLLSSIFGIILAIYPPAQVKAEVGSPVVYISVILIFSSSNFRYLFCYVSTFKTPQLG